jgi:hypothetical protein
MHRGSSPEAVAKSRWPDDGVSIRLINRATVLPAQTGNDAWAGVLARDAIGAFFASLAPASAASRLIAAGTTMPIARMERVLVPRRVGQPEGPDLPRRIAAGRALGARLFGCASTHVD